ncbi:hypothetical protein ACIBF5_17180 [Micromonospora sp. NPDC050417]|uniref:hypothetical protein n=1 Tax=Micromonospora sp. NPDC050417 TaxID=3364280 RepID=UPI0037A50F9C
MTCATCGVERTDADGHACTTPARPAPTVPASQPPLGWRVLTLAAFAGAAVHLVATVFQLTLIVEDYRFVNLLRTNPGSVTLDGIADLVDRQRTAAALIQLLIVAYLATYVAWHIVTRRTVERYGADRRATLAHWTVTTWQIAVAGMFLFSLVGRAVTATDATDMASVLDSAANADLVALVVTALRIPAVVLLAAGLYLVAGRVRRIAATRPPRPARHTPRATAPSTLVAPPDPVEHRAGDDAFWHTVASAAARASDPLPVLEAWAAPPRARRWHLITSEAQVTALRRGLSPTAGITVYGAPPRTPDEATLDHLAHEARRLRDDPTTGGAIGLIEESSGGMLRFDQLTSEPVLQSWLNRARTASRAGVYPTDAGADPTAITPT